MRDPLRNAMDVPIPPEPVRLLPNRARSSDPVRGHGVTVGLEVAVYSHSMVPGGLDVTSRTTRFTSRTSLVMRVEIFSSTS